MLARGLGQQKQERSGNESMSQFLLKNRKSPIYSHSIGSFERKGVLYKRSMNAENSFKKRNFVLQSEQLFYYKKGPDDKDPYFNLISLKNASIRILKNSPEQIKACSYHRYCLELRTETRLYYLASKERSDLEQWFHGV